MRHLVFVHQDGTSSAVAVNDMTVVNVKTWTPAVFGDGATLPQLVEDQSFSLAGVVSVGYSDDAPADATVSVTEQPLEGLTDAEAAALEAASVEGVAPNPWDEP